LAPRLPDGISVVALNRLAHDLVFEHRVASAVVIGAAAWRDGRWITEVGAAGRVAWGDGEAAVTPATWFDLASLTKPITALCAARLARANQLELGAPLGSILPELAGTPSETVSLELLLAHRAGLDAHRPLFAPLTRGKLVDRRAALVEASSARRRDAEGPMPDRGYPALYSDLGYLLAGEAIARAAGASLDDAVRRWVSGPLGAPIGSARQVRAQDAGFDAHVAATEFVAWRGGTIRGVVHDENAWALSGEGASGHAGLFGTADGVLAVGRAVVDVLHGRASSFLALPELEPLVRPRPSSTLRAGFDGKSEKGSLAGEKFGKSAFGHLGFTGTSFWCDPDRQLVGVVLTNRVHPSRENQAHRSASPRAYDRIADWADRGARAELW
jgi:CubicO group peptidase (beta-lactamase class C family)